MGIRLIVTDLDGTLIGRTSEFELYERFRDTIDDVRNAANGYWAVCTGRSLRSFKDFFQPLTAMGVTPDYVIVRHAFIYGTGRIGYTPHHLWNMRTRLLIRGDRMRMRRALRQWEAMVKRRFMRVRTIARESERLCLRLETERCATAAVELLQKDSAQCRHLRVFRYSREVDVRSVPFTKGLAVSELARHLSVDASEVLAIGDGYNDISMLDGATAGMTGCPANAEPEVTEVVHRRGGHIAAARAMRGVLEVIEAHRNGHVRNALPETWRDPACGGNPRDNRGHPSGYHRRRRVVRAALLSGAALATVLAFASQGMIPLSGLFMKPFMIVARLLEKAFDVVYR